MIPVTTIPTATKSMKKLLYIATLVTAVTACSEEPLNNKPTENVHVSSVTIERKIGEIPKGKLIYSTLSNATGLSLSELEELYKEDVRETEPDYSTNLKNMWMAVIKEKLVKEGTEEQKLFFIKEQAGLESNLPHISEFYTLLASSKLLNLEQKEKMADDFYEKNQKAIDGIQWRNLEDRNKKITSLVYAKRTFARVSQSNI